MPARASHPTVRARRQAIWRGALIGCIPLGLLLGMVGLALALTALVRTATVGQDVPTQRAGPLIILAVGVAVAVVTSILALVRIWRQMRTWQRAGEGAQASGAFWALALAALLVLLPFLLALVWPQHPAP